MIIPQLQFCISISLAGFFVWKGGMLDAYILQGMLTFYRAWGNSRSPTPLHALNGCDSYWCCCYCVVALVVRRSKSPHGERERERSPKRRRSRSRSPRRHHRSRSRSPRRHRHEKEEKPSSSKSSKRSKKESEESEELRRANELRARLGIKPLRA